MAEHNVTPKKRRLDIDRVHINLSQKELERYILEIAKEPVVFLDKISDWRSLTWTPETLAKQLSNVRTRFRFCPRVSSSEYCFPAKHAVMETDCHFMEGTFQDFYEWLTTDEANMQDLAFGKFPRKGNAFHVHADRIKYDFLADYSCYADYKYMKDLFVEFPGKLQDITWACLGFPTRTGEHSTFWMGSDESFTPCHYDSYGCNLVAQLYGKKKWLLFSPTQSKYLHPTRIPYEESSVFSLVNIQHPDHEKFPNFEHATCYEVVLEPGDVLFVPKHWWHYVECVETAISVNTWIELGSDNYDRIEEAITRALINPLKLQETKVRASDQNLWLNPSMREENLSFHDSMSYLRQALKLYHLEQMKATNEAEQQETKELGVEEFINTVVSPDVVRVIAQKLVEITKQKTS